MRACMECGLRYPARALRVLEVPAGRRTSKLTGAKLLVCGEDLRRYAAAFASRGYQLPGKRQLDTLARKCATYNRRLLRSSK